MQDICSGCGHTFADPMDPNSECTFCGGEVRPKAALFSNMDWKQAAQMLMKRIDALEKRIAELERK